MIFRPMIALSAEQIEDLLVGESLMREASQVIWFGLSVGTGFADEERQLAGAVGESWDPNPKVLAGEFETPVPKEVL